MSMLNRSRKVWAGFWLLSVAGLSGCQVDVGGQTLPSPYWHYDDVQYFPAGPEFKLSREAAALRAARQDEALRESGALPQPGAGAPAQPAAPAAPIQ